MARLAVGSMVRLFPERVKRFELTLKDSINKPVGPRSSIIPEEPSATASLKLITRFSKTLAVEDPVAGLKDVEIGATVSTTATTGLEVGEILPEGSVAVAIRLLVPSFKAGLGVIVQLPFESAVAVPTRVVPL